MAITLKAARINAGFNSVVSAAKALGVTKDILYNWENARSWPNVLELKKIESVYGVSYDDLIFLPKYNA